MNTTRGPTQPTKSDYLYGRGQVVHHPHQRRGQNDDDDKDDAGDDDLGVGRVGVIADGAQNVLLHFHLDLVQHFQVGPHVVLEVLPGTEGGVGVAVHLPLHPVVVQLLEQLPLALLSLRVPANSGTAVTGDWTTGSRR